MTEKRKSAAWGRRLCAALLTAVMCMGVLAGCAKEEKMDYPTGTKVPPAFLPEEEKPEPVEVKAKGYEYNEEELTYELVWSDEFDYEGLPDTEKWNYDVGGSGWGNAELQYYTNEGNAWVKDGNLTIECRREEKDGMDYTSARLVTKGKGDWLYGKVEVRAKLPKGLGTWPAIWMLPTDWEYGGWPESGEIDIMEHVGYDQDVVHASTHSKSYYHKINTQKTSTIRVEGASEDYHVYSMEWLPDKIRVFVDDELYFTFCPTDYDENPTWKEWPFDKKMHLILNIAFGGGWGGARGIDDSVLPQQMLVDYVRVYQSPELAGMQKGDKVLVREKDYQPDERFLKTDGIVVRNQSGKGDEVLLQGVNLGGLMVQEGWMCPLGVKDEKTLRETLVDRFGESGMRELVSAYQDAWITASDLDVIRETGYNFVRIPMYYGDMMDDNGALVSGAWKRLDWIIEECEKRDLYVVLDMHGAPGGQSDMDHCGESDGGAKLWKYDSWQQNTIRLWACIAERYRGCSTVAAYDLLNEPDKVDKASLAKLHRKIYEAIRQVDPDHIITMEAAWEFDKLPDPKEEGFENIIYQLHFYAMQGDEAGRWEAQNNMIDAKVADLVKYQEKWQVPLYVGEFNVFSFLDLWEKFIGEFQENKINWSNWTYKVSSDYGNWGLYNNSSAPAPNVKEESFESIKEKWSAFTTDSFKENTEFQEMLRKCLAK